MKHLILLCMCCIFKQTDVQAQDISQPGIALDTISKPVFYKATIFQTFHQTGRGYLVTVSDSSVFLSEKKQPLQFENVNLAYLGKFDYRSIEKIRLSNPGTKATAIIAGAVVGIIIGAIIGYSQGDDTGWFAMATAGDKAIIGGLAGGGAGVLVGGIIGKATEKTYLINGEWKNLHQLKETFQKGNTGATF